MNNPNLKIFKNRPILYYKLLTYIFLSFGLLTIPLTSLLLLSCLSLFNRKIKPNIALSLAILITDFITISSFVGMSVISLINGKILAKHDWLCDLNDLLYIGTTYCSAWLVALLTLERAIQIIYKISFSTKFWLILCLIEFIYFYTPNLVSVFLNEIGLADLAIYCMSTPVDKVGYFTIFWYGIIMTVSNLIFICSYIGIIFVKWKETNYNIKSLGVCKKLANSKFRKETRKEVLFLVLYLVGNGLEWYNTWDEIIRLETRSVKMDFISTCLMNFNPIVNNLLFILIELPVKKALFEKFPVLERFTIKEKVNIDGDIE